MEARQLEYAVAVADHGSFTRAATALGVAQPSLSHGVAALERQLGVRLFERLGRRTTLTDAGHHVIDAARAALLSLAEVEVAAARSLALERGSLSLVTVPTLAVDPLAAAVGRFRRRHPGVVVRVLEPEHAGGVEDSVRSGVAEIGLTDISVGGTGLLRIELFRQPVLLVAPPRTNLPDGAVPARDLAALPFIVTPAGTSTRRLFDRALAREGAEPNVAVELGFREAIVPLVLAGAGSCLLPDGLATEAVRRGAVVRPIRPAASRRVGLLHRSGPLSPAAEAMVDLLRVVAAERRGRAGPAGGS